MAVHPGASVAAGPPSRTAEPAADPPLPGESAGTPDGLLARGDAPPECPAGLPSHAIHELRTPLTSVHGYAQVLQRMLRDEPRASNALNVLVRESGRLTWMFDQLSQLAEGDRGDVRIDLAPQSVRPLVTAAISERECMDDSARPVTVAGDATAVCDGVLVERALARLLENAAQYSEPGTPIEIEIADGPTWVDILVADRGIGVPDGDARRIFERFERGQNARRHGVRGLGLGLYLARQCLDRIGGSLTYAPRPNGGTIFRIRLRRA